MRTPERLGQIKGKIFHEPLDPSAGLIPTRALSTNQLVYGTRARRDLRTSAAGLAPMDQPAQGPVQTPPFTLTGAQTDFDVNSSELADEHLVFCIHAEELRVSPLCRTVKTGPRTPWKCEVDVRRDAYLHWE